ncbi:MAG: type II secretion system F family protein [Peptostreptococcaceae bacterium]
MALYECVLYDKEGNRKNIKLEFDSEKDLNSYAIANEFKIANTKVLKEKRRNRIKNKELSIICNQMGMLLGSGCEITKSLNTIQSNCSYKLKSTLKKINHNLQKGNSISEAFQDTHMFSNFFVHMIKAGEISGKLDEILMSLSIYYKKEYEFRNKLLTSMIYPVVLVVVCIFVILFMLVYAVPNFQQSFIGNEGNLPSSTKILITVSNVLRNYYKLMIFINMILSGLIYRLVSKSDKLKYYFHEKIFKFKYTKNIVQTIEITKFTRCFYILISSGIQIVNALEISSNVIKNRYIYQRLNISKSTIQKGYSIKDSLELSGVFPDVVIAMIEVGEESGNIEGCLYNVITNYDNDLENFVNKIVKLIEPIIVTIMGILIGIIIISIMIPIFDALTSFQ